MMIPHGRVPQIASGPEKPTYPFTLADNGTGGDDALRTVGKGDPRLDRAGEGVATGSLGRRHSLGAEKGDPCR